MEFLSDIQYSVTFDCPYQSGVDARYKMFHAKNLSAEELEQYLAQGYRKFGTFFFMPYCRSCHECIPIRILTKKLKPTRSQKRALKKAKDVRALFVPPSCTPEVYDIYLNHSRRFKEKDCDKDEFISTFYTPVCPALQSEYYLDGTLFAVGFIDVSSRGFSSVYFIYRDDYAWLSPGTISVFYESREALRRGLDYYYLGYYVENNGSMNYKNNFGPHELFSWSKQKWYEADRDSNNKETSS